MDKHAGYLDQKSDNPARETAGNDSQNAAPHGQPFENSRRAAMGQIASTFSPRQAYSRSNRFTLGSQCGTMNSSRSPRLGSLPPASAVSAPNSSPAFV